MRRVLIVTLALVSGLLVSGTAFSDTVVSVYPGDDLDAKANAAPAGATIWVRGGEAGAATYFYKVDQPIELKAGQTLIGDEGTVTPLGPANVPKPTVGMKAANTSMSTMLQPEGDPVRIAWLDINVAGATKAINGEGGPNLQMDHVTVHGAQASGIGQYRGFVLDSEIYGNGTNPTQFDGTVAGIKCTYACEVARSYVHNNPGNGIWCDVGCQSLANQPNGFYVHDNVAGDNGRHGIFYENSPKPSINWGDVSVKALIQNNYVYGNGKSGISVSDSANATVGNATVGGTTDLGNKLGVTLSGVISHNAGTDKEGIELHSSGRSGRGIQKNALVTGNTMNGELIEGTGHDRDGTRNTGCNDNGNVCINNP